jgi:hypothetical protein
MTAFLTRSGVSMTFRWTKAPIDLAVVRLALQWTEAAEIWEAGAYTRYQLGEGTVKVFSGHPPTMSIHGTSEAAVHGAARSLRYADTDGTVSEIGDEVADR